MQRVLQVAFFHGATRSAKVSLERECYPDISSINGKNKLLLIIATILLYPHSPSKFWISTFLAILSSISACFFEGSGLLKNAISTTPKETGNKD